MAVNGGWGLQNNDHPVGSIDERWATSSPAARSEVCPGGDVLVVFSSATEAQMTHLLAVSSLVLLVAPNPPFCLHLYQNFHIPSRNLVVESGLYFSNFVEKVQSGNNREYLYDQKCATKTEHFAQNGIGT